MELLIKGKEIEEGINPVVPPGGECLKFIGFEILKLKKGRQFSHFKVNDETALVLFSGKFSIKSDGLSFEDLGPRRSLFDENPTTVYAPAGEKYTVEALEDVEIGLCYARTDKKKVPFLIRPEEIAEKKIGKDNYKRVVRPIFNQSEEFDRVGRLFAGETICPGGNWSSFPPHKHDRDMFPIESKLEEIYHFRINPDRGFCIQKIYTEEKDIDKTYTVENYDTVLIPGGYHPQASCPGYDTYYLWVFGGEKRQYGLYEDQRHAWIQLPL